MVSNIWRNGFLAALAIGAISIGLASTDVAWAQEAAEAAAPAVEAAAPAPGSAWTGDKVVNFALVNTILLISAVLVLFMQAGFALVEVGMNSAKNTVNILAKNVLDLGIGVILFFGIGYAIMYPGFSAGAPEDGSQEYFKVDTSRIFAISDFAEGGYLLPQIDFLFQVAFAATAATIVSGAVAGRMQFGGYLIYTAVLTGFVYPVSGSWKWGNGFLETLGFWDFAGSGLVHMLGGIAGLVGAIFLGPRLGRFSKDGKSTPIPGHNMTFAVLGAFILLIGWYGFNPGSAFGAPVADLGLADMQAYGLIATNTTLAACSGCVTMLVIAWSLMGKPDLAMALNGMLGGLVGITANCDCVSNVSALIIGVVAAIVCYAAIMALDMLKIDDPVGAFPVHGACGAWGLIACGIFGGKPMGAQITGTLAIAVWAVVTMGITFGILKVLGMLRVTAEEELTGLDISEHGMQAYPADAIPAHS
jgi:Amt family ammonium transporter